MVIIVNPIFELPVEAFIASYPSDTPYKTPALISNVRTANSQKIIFLFIRLLSL